MKRDKPLQPRNVTGKAIRKVRQSAKPRVSQEDLCGRVAKFGVILTRTQVAKIEAGKRPVFDYEAMALAQALEVTLNQLYGIRSSS
jgi:transcriptional regulator with XRE-family HTH domain